MSNIFFEESVKLSEEMKNAVRDGITRVAEKEGLPDIDVCVLICEKEEIAALNLEKRGVDSPTDVLSFPNLEFDEDFKPKGDPEAERDPETGCIYLGDIALCPDIINEHAKEYGQTPEREITYMAVHSMYHLLGYDHMTDGDKKIMRAKEKEIIGD